MILSLIQRDPPPIVIMCILMRTYRCFYNSDYQGVSDYLQRDSFPGLGFVGWCPVSEYAIQSTCFRFGAAKLRSRRFCDIKCVIIRSAHIRTHIMTSITLKEKSTPGNFLFESIEKNQTRIMLKTSSKSDVK